MPLKRPISSPNHYQNQRDHPPKRSPPYKIFTCIPVEIISSCRGGSRGIRRVKVIVMLVVIIVRRQWPIVVDEQSSGLGWREAEHMLPIREERVRRGGSEEERSCLCCCRERHCLSFSHLQAPHGPIILLLLLQRLSGPPMLQETCSLWSKEGFLGHVFTV